MMIETAAIIMTMQSGEPAVVPGTSGGLAGASHVRHFDRVKVVGLRHGAVQPRGAERPADGRQDEVHGREGRCGGLPAATLARGYWRKRSTLTNPLGRRRTRSPTGGRWPRTTELRR